MSYGTYSLNSLSGLLSHFPGAVPTVRDELSDEKMLATARVRSGDYLSTLATELDKIAQGLATVQAPEAVELERLVSELLYLNQNYTITRQQ